MSYATKDVQKIREKLGLDYEEFTSWRCGMC